MKEKIVNSDNLETKIKKESKKKKSKLILVLIFILIAIGVGLFLGYKRVISNPLSIYKSVINETYNLANNYLEENFKDSMSFNLKEDPFTISTNFTFDTEDEKLKSLNNYEYNLSFGLDTLNEQINLSLGLNNQNEQIINLLIAFLNDHTYLKSDELYNQVLDLGLSNLDMSKLQNIEVDYTYEDLQIVLSNMKTILINSLNKDKFSLSNETITINDKQIDAKKFTYLLDQENMERTINYISKEILKNDELMTSLSNITSLTKEQLEEVLKEEINYDNYEDIYINLYTNKTTKVIAGNIETAGTNIIRFTNKDNKFNMFIGDDYTNFIINYENDKLEISFNEYDEEIFNFTMITKEDNTKIEVTMNNYYNELKLSLETSNIKKDKNSITADYILDYKMNNYSEDLSFKIKGNLKVTKDKLESINPANSVNIETLTEEETNLLYENLMNVLEKLDLETYLEI